MHPYYPPPLQGHNAYHSSSAASPSSYGNPQPSLPSHSPYSRHLLQHPPPPGPSSHLHHYSHHASPTQPPSLYARSSSTATASSSSGPPPPLQARAHGSPHAGKPYSSPAQTTAVESMHARKLSYSDELSPPGTADAAAQPAAKRPRTARACLRCRAQKLKCSGEIPCQRCTRLQVTCRDAASAAAATAKTSRDDTEPSRDRQGHYDGSSSSGGLSTTERQLHSALRRIANLEASVESINYRLSSAPAPPEVHAGGEGNDGAGTSATTVLPPPPSVSQFPAPFTEVAYDKKMVENRQDTRANTPVDEEERTTSRPSTSRADGGMTGRNDGKIVATPRTGTAISEIDDRLARTTSRRKMGTLGSPYDHPLDPITAHIISAERAATLVDFFFRTCHPYVPLFDTRKLPRLEDMRRNEVFLLCAILAVAARYSEMSDASQTPQEAEAEREDLCQVAEAHMGRTLVVPRHRLGDVQAIVLLHAYSLRSGGTGHDPWILSGHAFRLAKRLSIDRIVTSQPDTHKISATTSMLRRTWLLLCASDCFPSLGFGRPASPRENLDSCAPILNLLAERYARREAENDDGDEEEDALDDAEFFIASQVELASISRRLLDWVAQTKLPLTRSSDLRAVAHKYDMLVDQLDTCQVRWNGPELGTPEQWFTSRLFRLHVRLCLATFTMRLSETALQNGSSTRKRALDTTAEGSTSTGTTTEKNTSDTRNRSSSLSNRKSSADMIAADRSREISDRLQVDCRRACLKAATEMCSVHKQKPLTYVPDYLITALAQAIITSIGVLETQQRLQHMERAEAESRAQAFVDDARQILSTFTSNQTGLADFLLDKVVDRARRSVLLEEGGGVNEIKTERPSTASNDRLSAPYERATTATARSPAAAHGNGNASGDPAQAHFRNDVPPSWRHLPESGSMSSQAVDSSVAAQQALFARTPNEGGAPTNFGHAIYGNAVPGGSTPFGGEMDLLLNGAGGFVAPAGQMFAGSGGNTGDDAANLQWGGLPQWWNGDDPLQLLFGVGTGDGTWPRAMSTSTTAEDRASVLNNGSEASPSVPAHVNAAASVSDTTSPLSHVMGTPGGGGGGGGGGGSSGNASVTLPWQRGRTGGTGE